MKKLSLFTKFILCLLMLPISTSMAYSQVIASCSNPKGKSYYPELGLVKKNTSGWTDDAITGGVTNVKKIGKDQYDVVFLDATKRITSSLEDGGNIFLLNKGTNVFSLLVVYPGQTAEIFTFLKNNSNKLEFIQVTSRAGDSVLFAKSTILKGECEFINFNSL